ncbi:hypothetical protein BDV97DRAFT_373911 [Delphinella strobiligena]|nr:hypothetical protein BDV97DRAFT_373911 [Delphinella strobiligena]
MACGEVWTTEARNVLTLLRGKKASSRVIQEELELDHASSWVDCFNGANFCHTLIAAGVQCLQQAQGSGFIVNYSITFLEAIGAKYNNLKLNVLLKFVNMMDASLAFYFVDKFGRRRCVVIRPPNNEQAEVPTLQLREKTITISTFIGFTGSVIATLVAPHLLDAGHGDLQGKVGFVWGSFPVASAIWTFFFVPQLKGRSLKELDELFEKRVNVFRFGNHETLAMAPVSLWSKL